MLHSCHSLIRAPIGSSRASSSWALQSKTTRAAASAEHLSLSGYTQRRQLWRFEALEWFAPSGNLHETFVPGLDARKVAERQSGRAGQRQEGGHAEVGVGNAVADQPVGRGEVLFEDFGGRR